MIIFRLNKKRYNLINSWDELPLDKAIKISKIELEDAKDIIDWYIQLDTVKELFLMFTDLELDKIEHISPHELVYYFSEYILPMVRDLKNDYPTTYLPKGISKFKHEGVEYIMPDTLDLGEDQILGHNMKVKPFREASNLLKLFAEMKHEGIKVMSYFCASIVRESEDEIYDEKVIAERAKKFET